jgi:urease accessory protein
MTQSIRPFLFLALLVFPAFAFAHTESGASSAGFFTGMMHPISGLDHVVAMVAVGLWGAQLRAPALWVLPVAFPLIMAFGGAAGAVGIDLPYTEIGIALSGLFLGSMVLFNVRMPLWAALIPVGIFAIFHGHAHGTEMPGFAVPLLYAAGFVIATGLLHLCGIAIGMLWKWPVGQWIVRGTGGIIAALGVSFLFG